MDLVTDSKNRTAAEIRKVFSKFGGNLGESGSVGWMFSKKGFIAIDGKKHSEDEVMEVALDLGADDIKNTGDAVEVYTTVENYSKVLEGLKAKNFAVTSSELTRIPQNTIKLEKDKAMTLLRLMDELENHDDVQDVASNADIDDSVFEEFANS
jgi:YebC/PmpR family DNA-binding regulatory protein